MDMFHKITTSPYDDNYHNPSPNFVFQSCPWRIPAQSSLFTPTSAQLTEIGDLWCPPMKAGTRVGLVNFQRNSNAGGTLLKPGNPNTIDFVSLFTGVNGAGFQESLTFNGSQSAVMPDGGFAISDPLLADYPGGYLRCSITTALGGNRPRWYSTRLTTAPQVLTGEVRRVFTGPQPSLRTSGINTGGGAGGTTTGYTPAFILKPSDGKRSFLLIADSLQQQDDDWRVFNDARGNFGCWSRAIDDSASTRMELANFGIPGLRASILISQWASAEGQFVNYIRDHLNNGAWPFHGVISSLLHNDFAALGDTANPDNMQLALNNLVSWVWRTFRHLPMWQATVGPRLGASADKWTTLAGQAPSNAVVDGALRDTFNKRLLSSPPRGLKGTFDLRDVDYVLDVTIPKLKQTTYTASGGGTLSGAVSIGLNLQTTGVTVSSTTAPEVGHYLVLTPGDSATVEQPLAAIGSVASAGANLWLVKTGVSASLTKAHLSGAVVRTSRSSDGTHWSSQQHKDRAAAIISQKAKLLAASV